MSVPKQFGGIYDTTPIVHQQRYRPSDGNKNIDIYYIAHDAQNTKNIFPLKNRKFLDMLKYVFIFGMEDVWMSFFLNDNISGKYCLKILQTLKGKPVARKSKKYTQ